MDTHIDREEAQLMKMKEMVNQGRIPATSYRNMINLFYGLLNSDVPSWYPNMPNYRPRVNYNYVSRRCIPRIKNVIFNDPATIVYWVDGTKTVVKCQEGDFFDPEKGLVMAITKKALGNQGNYFKEIKKWTETYVEKEPLTPDSVNAFLEIRKKIAQIAGSLTKQDTDKSSVISEMSGEAKATPANGGSSESDE